MLWAGNSELLFVSDIMTIVQNMIIKTIPKVFRSSQRTVTYYTATSHESNMTGSVSYTYSEATTKNIVFIRGDVRREWGMEGLYYRADAIVLARPNQNIQQDDKFIIDGETFKIHIVQPVEFKDIIHFYRGIAVKI